ncbi:hypothetical protein C6P40_001817 [Pichia californica]|uniref:Transcription initiation factor TFIID subunit 2 n=1 Tax=Pichia californica TaxID=460514 RepID=A0A9P6WIK8_9ASCO|nr:hypothetical protein C6P42_005086 [[Candida] californica]KAG0687834.1 hypothetical protein C6P40_001817 [[Candida] californica]
MENLILSIKPTPRTPITPRTPKTPKKHYNKHELDNIPSQKFKIGYQKVTLDVDLEQNSISAETEITVLPLDASLKFIKLDCRGIQIKSIIVNQRRANYSYDDFLQNQEYMNDPENPVLSEYNYDSHFDSNSKNISTHQHEMIRAKYYPLFSDQNDTDDPSSSFGICTSELNIKIPDSIKLRLQDTSKISFSPISTNRSMNETPNTANTLLNQEKVYTPLNIKIVYIVKNMKNGILFNGGIHTDIPKNKWHCYTFNNDFGCSTSSWVPCIDNFHEKPAWDINIIVPKTVGDIGQSILIGTKRAEKIFRDNAIQNAKEKNNNPSKTDIVEDNQDDENEEVNIESTPIKVVVPDLVSFRESPHPIDVAKKVINFQFYNPVCAHHLGFAIGCFDKTPIVDVKQGSGDLVFNQQSTTSNSGDDNQVQFTLDNANTNKVPTMLYFPPGKKEEVINSTIFLYKALDYYSKEFSSFPFTSYTLLFIDDLPCDICTFAGMTVASTKLLYGPKFIEPLFETTEKLSIALAEQYSGVNVLPKTLNDIWCTSGIARFMSNQFLKKLLGVNYYNFTFQKRCDLLCEIDVGKRPLSNQMFRFPINLDQDLDFIHLKAPLVLMILDKRITKTDKLFGLSRVIPKIFLQAMSNDLINGNNLSGAHFQRVCEKVAHHKLESFFQNWIHRNGVPTLRITQKFNKKRLFIEMSIRQMQRMSLNKSDFEEIVENSDDLLNFKTKSFVDSANTFMTENEHLEAQSVFTGPVTIRIHEADGSPYEHILGISDSLTKLDIQYNTKYRRRKKERREGDEADDKEKSGEKEKESRRKEKNDQPKINMLGNVLTTSDDIENWDLKENDANSSDAEAEQSLGSAVTVDDEKDEAFEWLRFDADNEWICKYTINLTDDKFESQLRQDRDVKAQYESVKHFGNVNRPTLYHARILLRTLVDSRYYYGVREEAAKSLAKISSEENDHIGMRFLLKTFKYLFCYENTIVKGYNEFDPNEYLPKPNDFSVFSNLFIMKAIIEALSNVRNKDGDVPIELKRILLNILKYNDNSNNMFDDSYYYSSIIKAVCNLIVVSRREIPSLDMDTSTKDSEIPVPRDGKDQFIYAAVKELNRCLKMDEWSPSYNKVVTKVVLEQKIRFVRSGLAKMTFMDILKYTTNKFNTDIRLIAFNGLLILGGLRNTNILNYYFTTMKLDESSYMKYQLNLLLVNSIGVAAYSGISSLLDDEEFLNSINGNDLNENVGNRMIHIEDSSSAKLSMQSRKDELSRQSIKGSIDLLRRDLAAKDSFMVTTHLPSDKQIVVKIKSKNTNSDNASELSFIVSLKREARFKIQLPSIKLKVNDDKPNVKHKRTASDLNLTTSPAKKPRKKKGGNNNIDIIKSATSFQVKIKLPSIVPKTLVTEFGNNSIIRHNNFSPLRYVRFNLIDRTVLVSSNEYFTTTGESAKCMVTLKINSKKWQDFLITGAIPKQQESAKFLIKLENTVDPSSSKVVSEGNEKMPHIIQEENTGVKSNTVKVEDYVPSITTAATSTIKLTLPKTTESATNDNIEEIKDEDIKSSQNISVEVKKDETNEEDTVEKEVALFESDGKVLDWSNGTASIIDKLSPVKRDTSKSPSPSAVSLTLNRSRSRSESPEIEEFKKKKAGPKIKLRLK